MTSACTPLVDRHFPSRLGRGEAWHSGSGSYLCSFLCVLRCNFRCACRCGGWRSTWCDDWCGGWCGGWCAEPSKAVRIPKEV